MYPGAHRQLGNEDVASFGEQDRRLGRDHLDLRVGLHDLLDPRQWELMLLVVMRVILQRADRVLPVGGEDVAVVSLKALIDLDATQLRNAKQRAESPKTDIGPRPSI